MQLTIKCNSASPILDAWGPYRSSQTEPAKPCKQSTERVVDDYDDESRRGSQLRLRSFSKRLSMCLMTVCNMTSLGKYWRKQTRGAVRLCTLKSTNRHHTPTRRNGSSPLVPSSRCSPRPQSQTKRDSPIHIVFDHVCGTPYRSSSTHAQLLSIRGCHHRASFLHQLVQTQ